MIGPLLWNLVYDVLLRLTLPPGCKLIRFADDVVLIVTLATLLALKAAVIKAIGKIGLWLRDKGFQLAREKTEDIFLNAKRVPDSFVFTHEEH